jgi:hypothetical protein
MKTVCVVYKLDWLYKQAYNIPVIGCVDEVAIMWVTVVLNNRCDQHRGCLCCMTLVLIHAPFGVLLKEDMFYVLLDTVAKVWSCSTLKALLIMDK